MVVQRFDERRFNKQIEKALEEVKKVLDANRTPKLPADVPHRYEDKFLLAEFLSRTAFAAQLNCLEIIGITDEVINKLKAWTQQNKTVTLRFITEETCEFVRKQERKVDHPKSMVTEIAGKVLSIFVRMGETVTEYVWKYELKYSIYLFPGVNVEDKIELQSKVRRGELISGSEHVSPRPKALINDPVDLNLNELLAHLNENNEFDFKIDRNPNTCHTPRRNSEITRALNFFNRFYDWAGTIHYFITQDVFPLMVDHHLNLSSISADTIFNPILPLFDKKKKEAKEQIEEVKLEGQETSKDDKKDDKKKPKFIGNKINATIVPIEEDDVNRLLTFGDINKFLLQEKRDLVEKLELLETLKIYPEDSGLITLNEANILIVLLHARDISQYYKDGLHYIENLIMKQVIDAIGKVLTPVDFSNYMIFHNRKLFAPQYQPTKFSYAVRRGTYNPEGIISIETPLSNENTIGDPISTITHFSPSQKETKSNLLEFPINAATKIKLYPERYLHGYILNKFSNETIELSLQARAKQFSCYILLIGRVITSNQFNAKYGIILKNKDELKIPLLLSQIPSKKEFKDATDSLSPEQKAFAKAYRSMQLESTVFGMLVIQIKPQLEKCLNLPQTSLTKEIKLTQSLIDIFLQYQVSSDLLSFPEEEEDEFYKPPPVPTAQKIEFVKAQVANMQSMINDAKKEEIEKEMMKRKFNYDEPVKQVVQRVLKKASYSSSDCDSEEECDDECEEEYCGVECEKEEMKCYDDGGAEGGEAFKDNESAPEPASEPVPEPAPEPQSESKKDDLDDLIDDLIEQDKKVELKNPSKQEKLVDYTKLPTQLDKAYNKLDPRSTIRPTIINTSDVWSKRSKPAILADPIESTLIGADQQKERNDAFDLLDCLTRSGGIEVEESSYHVFIPTTHCFDRSLINTLVKDNVNPIERVERSTLIMASTIHGKPPAELIKPNLLASVKAASPSLFE